MNEPIEIETDNINKIKITYEDNRHVGALVHISLISRSDHVYHSTIEVVPGKVFIDLDKNGRATGIEFI